MKLGFDSIVKTKPLIVDIKTIDHKNDISFASAWSSNYKDPNSTTVTTSTHDDIVYVDIEEDQPIEAYIYPKQIKHNSKKTRSNL